MPIKENLSFKVTGKTKGSPPYGGLPFLAMKEAVLGKKYSLSLAFVESSVSRVLNRIYRGKNSPTDILSFPLSKNEGEIVIDLKTAKKEAEKFHRQFKNFIGFLFIHGLTHLKGHRHGSRMESKERKVRVKFKI